MAVTFQLFSFLVVCLYTAVCQSVPAFKDYTFSNETQTYYRCYGTPVNFTTALEKCAADGANLGVPRNKLEFDTLIANFGERIYSVWLDLSDRETEGKFVTTTGIPVNLIYTKWEGSEPNDGGGNEDCVEMLYDGRYNDVRCEDVHAYICVKPLKKSINEDETAPLHPFSTPASHVSTTRRQTVVVQDSFVTPPTQPTRFRKDYKYVAETGYYYKAHLFAKNFSTAVITCKAEGAELAVPITEKDAKVLTTQFRPGVEACWIGIHDILVESEFQTINGTPASEIYLNWKSGFPKYHLENTDCVIMDNKGYYYDTECGGNYQFICARHESTVVSNFLCDTYDEEYFYNIEGDRCYKLHTQAATWNNALRVCRAEEASLAIVNSAAEAKTLTDSLSKHQGSGNYDRSFVHVDFNDLLISQSFMTSTGMSLADVGYEVWGQGEPNNVAGNEHCGGMLRDGKLADVNCNTRALFFCEKILKAPLSFELLQRGKQEGRSSHQG